MQAYVVSPNGVTGLGLKALAESSGLEAVASTFDEARSLPGGSLVVLYLNAWYDNARRVVQELRQTGAQLIVVVGRMAASVRRTALGAGALHAFSQDEVDELAQVLRNYQWSASPSAERFTLANGLVVNLRRRRVERDGHHLELTRIECDILAMLADRARADPGRPVRPQEIILAVWGATGARSEPTLRGHISHIRGKVQGDSGGTAVLLGRRGHGYWLQLHGTP